MISAERMKSVRTAPLTWRASSSCGRVGLGQFVGVVMVAGDDLDDLLGRFEGEIAAAEHQQGGDQEGGEGREQERAGEEEEQFVLEAADA